MTARDGKDAERFEMLKPNLWDKCQWEAVGYPGTWPENIEAAMLDRGDEVYGLGIESDTTEDKHKPDDETA